MHILMLSKRDSDAQTRLLETARRLADLLKVDERFVQALHVNVKDLAVRAMMEREAMAAILSEIEAKLTKPAKPVEPQPVSPPLPPVTMVTEEHIEAAIPAPAPVPAPASEPPAGKLEALPAPTSPLEKKPRKPRGKKG